jgi:hypothetical protein
VWKAVLNGEVLNPEKSATGEAASHR